MVSLQSVEDQLKQIGFNFHAWGRGEIKELCKILAENETIKQCSNGYYQGGFAMLVATDQRLMLVDRKPMYLTLESIWYDKIGQIDYNHRLLNATICISSPNKEVNFTSFNHARLRQILVFSQQKMIAAKEGESPEEAERQAEESMERQAPKPQAQHRWYPGAQPTQEYSQPAPAAPSESPPWPAAATQQRQEPALPISDLSTSPHRFTVYRATSLPFSRRRYFTARQEN